MWMVSEFNMNLEFGFSLGNIEASTLLSQMDGHIC